MKLKIQLMYERRRDAMRKNLRKKHGLSEKSKAKLLPKTERLSVEPRTKETVCELKGLAKDV